MKVLWKFDEMLVMKFDDSMNIHDFSMKFHDFSSSCRGAFLTADLRAALASSTSEIEENPPSNFPGVKGSAPAPGLE